jgi:3-phosphoshikimate 1-carboxyvinyltransferase
MSAPSSVFVAPALSVQGEVHLPGDKSLSHRALLLALISTRRVRIENLATGEDVQTTLRVVEQLGATVVRDENDPTNVAVTGVGLDGVQPPADGAPIYCGNAGTLVRMLAGILAAQPSGREFTLTGDESLSGRPMARVATPLTEMGARVTATSSKATLPMKIVSGAPLHGGTFELPVATAQVQSALLLAGLRAEAPTTVIEPGPLRDHTERMLRRAGAKITRAWNGGEDDPRARVTIEPIEKIQLPSTRIPGDPSSAAFLITAATVLHGSLLRIPNVLDNKVRNGFVDVLEQMGARFAWSNRSDAEGEAVADLEVRHGTLGKIYIELEDVTRMIDELPIFALAAQFRKGETVIRGAAELREKESDRIEKLALAMRRVGVSLQPLKDGYIVRGSTVRPDGGTMDAAGDHRLARVGGIAGLVSRHGVTIENADCVDVSFPGFFDLIEAIAVR